jgi:hypothetical protein
VSAKLPLLSSQAVPLRSAGCPRKRFTGSRSFYALQYRPVPSSTQLRQISAELNLYPNVARQGSKPTASVDMSSVTGELDPSSRAENSEIAIAAIACVCVAQYSAMQ